MLRTSFSGGGGGEAKHARRRTGAVVHYVFHEGLGKVGDAGVKNLLGLRAEVGDDITVGVADGGEHPGVDVDTVICKDGVGSGHFDG